MRSAVKLNPSISATRLSPLCLYSISNSVHWTMTVTAEVLPFDEFGDHRNSWATMSMALPSFCLLNANCCAPILSLNRGVFQGRHKGHWSSTRKTDSFRFRRPLSVLVIVGFAQRWHEAVALCKGGFKYVLAFLKLDPVMTCHLTVAKPKQTPVIVAVSFNLEVVLG